MKGKDYDKTIEEIELLMPSIKSTILRNFMIEIDSSILDKKLV